MAKENVLLENCPIRDNIGHTFATNTSLMHIFVLLYIELIRSLQIAILGPTGAHVVPYIMAILGCVMYNGAAVTILLLFLVYLHLQVLSKHEINNANLNPIS